MTSGMSEIDPAIRQTFGTALDLLMAKGWRARQLRSDAECFGNFILAFTGRRPNFQIVRDRGEYRIEAASTPSPPPNVYTDPVALAAAILLWANEIAEVDEQR